MNLIRWRDGWWALLVLAAAALMACGLAGYFLIPAALIAMLVELIRPDARGRLAENTDPSG